MDTYKVTVSMALSPFALNLFSNLIITWNDFILNANFLFELRHNNEIRFYITLDVRKYWSYIQKMFFEQ